MIGHVAQSYLDSGMLTEANGFLHVMYSATYCFHMPFFFIISGFLYFHSYFVGKERPQYDRLGTQILNLLAVYILFSVMYGCYRILFAHYANEATTVVDILLIPIYPLGVYWYLQTLLLLYLLFMIPGVTRQRQWLLLAVTGLFCVTAGATQSIPLVGPVLSYSFYFCIGFLLSRSKKPMPLSVLFLTAVAIGFLAWIKMDWEAISANRLWKVAVALGISFGLWILFERVTSLGSARCLQICGKHSLEIYVIHTFSTSGCRGLLPFLGIHNAYLCIILNFIISMTVPFFGVWIAKKLHLYDLAFRPVKLWRACVSRHAA